MTKKSKLTTFVTLLFIFSFFVVPFASAVDTPPSEPSGGQAEGQPNGAGDPSQTSQAEVSHTGATTFTSDTTDENKKYSSTTGGENAILVSGGTVNLNTPAIEKSGDSDGDSADFYGTNAAVFVNNGATLNINGGSLVTNGAHANGLFAYGTGVLKASNVSIKTNSNNSGGIMVTGGGTLTADNCSVVTEGNSSAPIRSDRGGGTMTITGGTYESNGTGSPVIYSTAKVTVSDATLLSTASEGVVVEGANSVALDNVILTDTNTKLNGQSETYKNIFLYQSMSGDADEGTASFTAKDSVITTNKGDTFFVTNTTATISLENNAFTNTSGDFLRIEAAAWGTSGKNGGNVTLNLTNQNIKGDILVDSISTLDIKAAKGSIIIGAINSKNTGTVSLTLSEDSVLSLTADTYLASLKNSDSENSNIYSNGKYKLYVNGSEVSINSDTYTSSTNSNSSDTDSETYFTPSSNKNNSNVIIYVILGILGAITLVGAIAFATIHFKNKKSPKNKSDSKDVPPTTTPPTTTSTNVPPVTPSNPATPSTPASPTITPATPPVTPPTTTPPVTPPTTPPATPAA